MPSYTTRLRLEQQVTGDNNNTWGDRLNVIFGLLDDAIAGMATIATTGGTTTLTANNSATDQARNAFLKVTGVLTSNAIIVVPPQTKQYGVWNATTGAFTLSVKTSGGTAVLVTQSKKALVFCDGADCSSAFDDAVNLGVLPLTGGTLSGALNLQAAPVNESKTSVASATSPDIWSAANVIDYTGTATATSFPNAPQAGAKRTLICAAACTFTHSANLILPGSTSYTAAAGDRVEVVAVTSAQFRLSVFKADGTAVVGGAGTQGPAGPTGPTGPAGSSVPTGTLLDFAGSAAPSGFSLCDGSAVSRATFSALFAVIGTNWGNGDGSTTFNLPDLRRRVAVGSGGSATGTLGNTLASAGGSETHALITAELASHSHVVNDPNHSHGITDPTHAHNAVDSATFLTNSGTLGTVVSGAGFSIGSPSTTTALAPTGVTVNAAATGISIQSSGVGTAHNNMQPSVVVTKIIKT